RKPVGGGRQPCERRPLRPDARPRLRRAPGEAAARGVVGAALAALPHAHRSLGGLAMLRWSAHVSMLFGELPLLERPAAASAAGFMTVECWWPGAAAGEWAAAVRRAGVAVALLNADGGDIAAGDRGFLNIAGRRDRELEAVAAALELARGVGAPCINVLVGR